MAIYNEITSVGTVSKGTKPGSKSFVRVIRVNQWIQSSMWQGNAGIKRVDLGYAGASSAPDIWTGKLALIFLPGVWVWEW